MITNAIILAAALHAPFSPPQSWWNALAQVETGGNNFARGDAGEVSEFQIMPAYWKACTDLPLDAATNPITAQSVAIEIVRRRTHGKPLTAEAFAKCWHGWRDDARHRDYLKRFLNLVDEK